PTLKLPRTLERPPLASDSASRLALDAVAPDLAELPLPFIHHQIALHSEQMLAGFRDLPVPSTIPLPPVCSTPDALTIRLPSRSSGCDTDAVDAVEPIYPTHVFAVSPPQSKNATTAPEDSLQLVPFHGPVFAANCAAQILRPASTDEPDEGDGDANADMDDDDGVNANAAETITLPVCTISLPSVQAFFTLRTYMYTKRISALFTDFFPLADTDDDSDSEALNLKGLDSSTALRLATRLVLAHPGFTHILECASRILDVWKTAWCLGLEVYPDAQSGFWDALDLAWEVVLAALNL
ncbi:hypothetical protein K438DRAFT_1502329, partial [Mycena galopus ATCC 62051]